MIKLIFLTIKIVRRMIGKDEVSSSNLDSSSKIKARNHLVLGLFVLFSKLFWML